MQFFIDGQADAFMGFPPEPQELRARKIGHVVVSMTTDRPWSQYFCCMLIANRAFVRHHPSATKRALRAILKANEVCALEPETTARLMVERGYTDSYDLALAVVKEIDETGMPTGRLLLADGFLRAEALHQLGRVEAVCTIYTGDIFTANLIAAHGNGGRGLQFELYERKHTARRLLIDLAKQEAAWSIQEIADLTGLDRATVRELSQDLKHRGGLAIADAVDAHICDGPASTDLADERDQRPEPYVAMTGQYLLR